MRSTLFSFTSTGTFRHQGEVQNGLDPCVNDLVDDGLRVVRRDGDDRNVESFAPREPFQVADVVNGYTAARFMPIFSFAISNSAAISKPS